jgi:ribosomal protein S18 acetylase RimI-like enzyme
LNVREICERDIEELFVVRAATRQNAMSKEQLARMGITPASIAESLTAGRSKGWVGVSESRIVGFCMGDSGKGEVLVLAMLPDFEGRGIGATLLSRVVEWLRSFNPARVWLSASSDPATRAYGFYRAAGWRPIGEIDANGDEILVLDHRHLGRTSEAT